MSTNNNNNTNNTTAATTDAAADGRLLVEESFPDIENDRIRFEVELKQGETTIVSWDKLLQDSGFPVDHYPSSSESDPDTDCEKDNSPPKPLHQEDETRNKCSNIVSNKTKDEQIYYQPKSTKKGHARVKSVTLKRHISEENTVNIGRIELPDLNVPYTVHTAVSNTQTSLPTHIKDESSGMLNGSMLESSILEMETMVAESRRLHHDDQDADHSVATKTKLPRELKQKLETIARLAHMSQGGISDELITRLMSILGQWLKLRTLKRCLRNMVPSELSASACGGDAIRFSQIKKEVIEMIKFRNPSTETKDGSDTETIELDVAHKAKYSMDHEMEDKICDFYDFYVQGTDEIKSSEIRKFYIQLAALWPKRTMNNHGIRNAICRSKERRRTALQEKGQETCKRKKLSAVGLDEDLHEEAKLAPYLESTVIDTIAPDLTFLDNVTPSTPELSQNLSAPSKRFSPLSAGSCQDILKQTKFDILSETT